MTYAIVPALACHVPLLRARLRDNDAFEITCTGVSVRKALWRSFRLSVMARTAFVDGEIACMWGVAGHGTLLGGVGEPWLMTSKAIERIPVSFVREARAEVAEMLDIFPRLSGYVSQHYVSACRFLEVLGFTLGDPEPVGTTGALFRRCTMER